MQAQTKTPVGLTGNQLKILALVAMTCDHVGLQLLPRLTILRIIGRLAAPLFAYMIAEGCRFTRHRGRYLGRMLGMAALCQTAYFFATGSVYQCIFVTFSLSICLIYAIENAVKHRNAASVLLAAVTFAAVCFICVILPRILTHTDFAVDYGLWGVMLPVLVYAGRTKEEKLALSAAGLCLLGFHYGGIQWWALLSLPPLMLYNGRRGKWNIGKFFYFYYPIHLVVIYGLSLLF
ncbi:MAG: TraX family protein [Faecousia sp.]